MNKAAIAQKNEASSEQEEEIIEREMHQVFDR